MVEALGSMICVKTWRCLPDTEVTDAAPDGVQQGRSLLWGLTASNILPGPWPFRVSPLSNEAQSMFVLRASGKGDPGALCLPP